MRTEKSTTRLMRSTSGLWRTPKHGQSRAWRRSEHKEDVVAASVGTGLVVLHMNLLEPIILQCATGYYMWNDR